MYLYKAIEKVLQNHNNTPMTVEEIASEINRLNLYLKKNGNQTNKWGVGARALSDVSKSQSPMFDVLIKLR